MKRGLALSPQVRWRFSRLQPPERRARDHDHGAGSTFVSPLVSAWTPALGTAFDYTCSTRRSAPARGIQAISNRPVDFGASDAPLNAASSRACNGLRPDPVGARRDGDRYNVPATRPPLHLHLDGDMIAKIFMGQITNWNDPAIAALNPGGEASRT